MKGKHIPQKGWDIRMLHCLQEVFPQKPNDMTEIIS